MAKAVGYGVKIPVSNNNSGYGVQIPVSKNKSGYGVQIPVSKNKSGYGVQIPVSDNKVSTPPQTSNSATNYSQPAAAPPKPSRQAIAKAKGEKQKDGLAKQASLQDAEGTYQKKTKRHLGFNGFRPTIKKETHWEKTGTASSDSQQPLKTKTLADPARYGNEKNHAKFREENFSSADKQYIKDKGGVVRTKYMDEQERKNYEVGAKNGKLQSADGTQFDTTGSKGGIMTGSKDNRKIFVMDENKKMYAADALKEESKSVQDLQSGKSKDYVAFHHSSFTSGSKVAAAGEIEVRNGQVKTISDRSGHYKPGADNNAQVVKHLQSQGVNVDNTKFEMTGKNKITNQRTGKQQTEPEITRYATEVVAANGNEKALRQKVSMLNELEAKTASRKTEMKQYTTSSHGTGTTLGSHRTNNSHPQNSSGLNSTSESPQQPASNYSKTPNSGGGVAPSNTQNQSTAAPAADYNRTPNENGVAPVSNQTQPSAINNTDALDTDYNRSPTKL